MNILGIMDKTLKLSRKFSDLFAETFLVSDYSLSPRKRKSLLLRRFAIGGFVVIFLLGLIAIILQILGSLAIRHS